MKKILVPTDFSEQADNALKVACQIALKSKAEIHLLHVLDASLGGDFNTMGAGASISMDQVYVVQLREVTHQRLLQATQKYYADEYRIVPEVSLGNVYAKIILRAELSNSDLIVIGAKGSSGLEEFFVGSNTEKIIRRSPCPVLSVKKVKPNFTIEKIVFASNFESELVMAVKHIKRFQELFNAELHLVYINVVNKFVKTRSIRARMNEFVQKYQLSYYNFTIYDDKSEEEGIIHFAEEINADLIAVATHGRTGLAHLLSGSIAEDIVNHANRPVLTLNPRSFIEKN